MNMNLPDKQPLSIEQNKPALTGLSTAEAAERLKRYGSNAVREQKAHPVSLLIKKFWGPIPWMLEVTILLEIYLGKTTEAMIISALLVFNAMLSFFQERHAQNALELLRQKLTVQSRVLRDGTWQVIPAENLVPGDIIHLRMGDFIPADVKVLDGQIQMDQSSLTGESAPVDGGKGQEAYAGAIVKRGEATGEVIATGTQTKFGKTAELVRTAKTASHLEEVVFSIVKYLVVADVALAGIVAAYSVVLKLPWHTILPFILILLVASVPVALPAMFTLTTALGATELSRKGVLVSRLSAIEEAAAMDVLASDKTGTLTENRLSLAAIKPYPPFTEEEILQFAILASDEATQDPLDLAILEAARQRKITVSAELLQFTPFDPEKKRSEGLIKQPDGTTRKVMKGAPLTLAQLSGVGEKIEEEVHEFAQKGYRVLAVAVGNDDNHLRLAGLIGLYDPPRKDSKELIQSLGDLGIRVLMVTGDDAQTAQAVAQQVGLSGNVCSVEAIKSQGERVDDSCHIFAGVFPEDKIHLVQKLQKAGHIVGMTGDGVNDAPALKQAEVGIAVASATDVAKAAASLVLTTSGLGNILSAVKTSREIYQRMLTYTLNKIIKTFQIALFLSLGFLLSREFVITPLQIVLLLFANDFMTMSIATDRVTASSKPDRWNVFSLMKVALLLALPVLLLSFGFFYTAKSLLHLPLEQVQSLMFVMLVFTGQANVYLVRERHHVWNSVPSRWMLLGTLVDVLLVSLLASQGILIPAIPFSLIGMTLAVVGLYLLLIDRLKMRVFRLARF
ncbi:plasma-membrane proton-efflux P-type ATPase [Anaerolinea thermophila]|uniref:Cation-transporting ATPase n=1 Tax=Anaerolinea thermophila (strain DSM 14523 / JCM 11388 / NBRC 100420 / UNI-1) TaxID=926569 RepID=E8N2G4_ANATU|nr:plasma-membrane proton-efflux P-type ATPase [Anaerolinea thermophila]BAJ62770.1 cation-transporting ATPase [Anaerolinea thermophila UNI-1]